MRANLVRRNGQQSKGNTLLVLHCAQAFVESKDGTKIPMFIVHRAGIQMDGSNPTLLYGYGGELLPVLHLGIKPKHLNAAAQL